MAEGVPSTTLNLFAFFCSHQAKLRFELRSAGAQNPSIRRLFYCHIPAAPKAQYRGRMYPSRKERPPGDTRGGLLLVSPHLPHGASSSCSRRHQFCRARIALEFAGFARPPFSCWQLQPGRFPLQVRRTVVFLRSFLIGHKQRRQSIPWRGGDVRYPAAGSTGRRNTGVKSLCRGFKLQGLPRPFVELTRHSVQMGLRVHIPANKSGSVRTSSFCGSTIPQWGRNGYPTGVQLEPDDGIILD